MSRLYHVSAGPHILGPADTRSIMGDVIIALLPAAFWGVWLFGPRAGAVVLLSVSASVGAEYIWNVCAGRPQTADDLSAAVTGLLLGLNLSASVPLWIPVLGSLFSIVIVKQCFGGLGHNFMNPALAGRCFLLLSFPEILSDFPGVDGASSATPLALIRAGEEVPLSDLFFGYTSGCIGEVSALLLLAGGCYLLTRRVITWEVPLSCVASAGLFLYFFGGNLGCPRDLSFVLREICGGGLLLGAVFMATDYVTGPVTRQGRLLYGAAAGCLIGLFRVFGSSPEGTSYAIILGNTLSPVIEEMVIQREIRKKNVNKKTKKSGSG